MVIKMLNKYENLIKLYYKKQNIEDEYIKLKDKIRKIIDDNFIKLEEVECRFYDYWEPNLLIIPLKNYLISKEKFSPLKFLSDISSIVPIFLK